MTSPRFVPLNGHREYPPEVMEERALSYYREMNRRRTARQFSDRPVPRSVIENCVRTAGTAPSGAHMQPWHFVVVTNQAVKRAVRAAAEEEERDFYDRRAPREWLEALAPLGTDEHKPYLETAPHLIAIFIRRHGVTAQGKKIKHYYAVESVGIATGLLISAVHNAGLVSLTHTPSPMGFLNRVLDRPASERPFLLLVVGHPAEDARVPDIRRLPLCEIATFLD